MNVFPFVTLGDAVQVIRDFQEMFGPGKTRLYPLWPPCVKRPEALQVLRCGHSERYRKVDLLHSCFLNLSIILFVEAAFVLRVRRISAVVQVRDAFRDHTLKRCCFLSRHWRNSAALWDC